MPRKLAGAEGRGQNASKCTQTMAWAHRRNHTCPALATCLDHRHIGRRLHRYDELNTCRLIGAPKLTFQSPSNMSHSVSENGNIYSALLMPIRNSWHERLQDRDSEYEGLWSVGRCFRERFVVCSHSSPTARRIDCCHSIQLNDTMDSATTSDQISPGLIIDFAEVQCPQSL
jgi:hypothetical protein